MGCIVLKESGWNDGQDMFPKAKLFEILPVEMNEIDIRKVSARNRIYPDHSHRNAVAADIRRDLGMLMFCTSSCPF
jgi:hypothetical protein